MTDPAQDNRKVNPLHSARAVFSWIIPYLAASKARVVALLFLSIISSIAATVNIHVMRYFIDHLATTRDFATLWMIFAVYLASILVSGLADYGYTLWIAKLRRRLSKQLKTNLFRKYQLLSLDFFQAR